MIKSLTVRLLSAVGLLVLAACTSSPMTLDPELLMGTASPQPTQPLPTREPPELIGTLEPAPGIIGTPVTGEAPAEVVAAMIAALSELTGVPAAEIVVLSDEAVVWNDGALGCPQPGVVYTQALVNGYRIQLQAAEAVYVYHVGERPENYVLCVSQQNLLPVPIMTPVEPNPDR